MKKTKILMVKYITFHTGCTKFDTLSVCEKKNKTIIKTQDEENKNNQ
jgi:hypothetical protein